ncbi:MAG: SH3 domain-containing protein [Flavobacterium sp.]|nr:MAG: SH3 domain-containing protein [Flavobacterium sp.]
MKKIIYLTLLSIVFISCDSNEINIKKTYLRLNDGEISATSKYIWPEDHKNLYTFEQRFLNKNKLLSFDIETIEKLNADSYCVTFNCSNGNEELSQYFKKKGNFVSSNKIVDTFFVKKANGQEYITFDWDLNEKFISNNVKLSSILVERLNLRSGPGQKFNVIGQLENGDELLIDDSYENSNWRKGIGFDENGNIKQVYFSSKLTDRKEISFFTLNWEDSLGIVVISLLGILVLFVVYPLLFSALFRAGGDGAGTFAIILFVVLIVAVYFTYQIIETAVFELFMINLPF